MNKRQFNKQIRLLTNKKTGLLDIEKIDGLEDQVKSQLVYFIVRSRGAIIRQLIPDGFDWTWLHSMGYLYRTKNKHFEFVCTSENQPKG